MPRKIDMRLTKTRLNKIREAVAKGATRASIAEFLGISSATFYRWLEKSEDLRTALDAGKDSDFQFMMNLARERAETGSYSHWAAYMKVIHGVAINDNGATGNTSIVVHLNLGQSNGGVTIEHQKNAIEHKNATITK